MQVILMTGSSGTQCSRRTLSAMFTIEQYGVAFFIIFGI
jgi:hypothetical protein